MLKIPFLDEILVQLEERGDVLDASIDRLLESLDTVNESLVRVAEALEKNNP